MMSPIEEHDLEEKRLAKEQNREEIGALLVGLAMICITVIICVAMVY